MSVIETTNLSKRYGTARGITDLNLKVEEGAFFGFIGPNGAGKSTTIRLLLGLIRPSEGQASLFSAQAWQHRKELLSKVGFMPSEAMFYTGMRVRDIIRLSADLRGKDCKAEANRLCERLQLDTGKKIEALSLGNRKKVAIVCALQHMPQLYIFDEPTSGLDPLIQREFFSLLEERNRAGATVFLSSHVLAEVQRYCTQAAIIRDGRLIACDRMDALTRTNAKRVTLRGTADLSSLSGIRDLKWEEGAASFLYSGDLNALLVVLARGDLTELSLSEPALEEIFLHYYTGGDQA